MLSSQPGTVRVLSPAYRWEVHPVAEDRRRTARVQIEAAGAPWAADRRRLAGSVSVSTFAATMMCRYQPIQRRTSY
ncbi:hypothetical protein AQI88_31125 [Streptomyces cellostaticus]|uniref:Uncharacterized protein n=1 Tax=Streptomyces cellostaticus TaxID=67285 RepID=A0A117PUQ7_9ACTN|nr:hypothetical protein AQI88_31125 [Streptomyces cellostaticus]GHI10529.1 hypothetical protein Scel_88500 [Streptomyces cellostaticus]